MPVSYISYQAYATACILKARMSSLHVHMPLSKSACGIGRVHMGSGSHVRGMH